MKARASRLVMVIWLAIIVCFVLVSWGDTSFASGKPRKIVFANSSAASAPASRTMKVMGKKIEELSQGSLEVGVYVAGQLGSATSLVQGLQQGTVDMIVTGDSYYAGLVPEIQVFELPFLFNSYDSARKALDGPVGKEIRSLFAGKGIKPIDFWEIGFRHITNSIRPIKEPEDLKGIKLRTLPAPIQVKTWKMLGALPTPIDFSELYSALQQRVVDGQENPLNLINAQKFYEVQKYLSLTGHVYSPMMLAMSQRTWDQLNEQQKKAILMAAKEAQVYERSLVKKGEDDDLAAIISHGVVVEKSPDIAAFKKIAVQAYGEFTNKYGDKFIKEIQAQK